jgi:hypothetical protein
MKLASMTAGGLFRLFVCLFVVLWLLLFSPMLLVCSEHKERLALARMIANGCDRARGRIRRHHFFGNWTAVRHESTPAADAGICCRGEEDEE